jgi:hypothetical protein
VREALGRRYDDLEVDGRRPRGGVPGAGAPRPVPGQRYGPRTLKVQYPELAAVIDDDFDAVVRMLVLARWVRAGRELDEWMEDLRVQLHHEIDYERELAMTREARERLRCRLRVRDPITCPRSA